MSTNTLQLETYKTLSEILKISEVTLRRWKSEGRIQATKIGGAVRFTPEQVSNIVKNGPVSV